MKSPYDQSEDVMPGSLALAFVAASACGAAIWSLILFALL